MHQLLIRIYYSFLVRHENYWLCFAYEKDYHWAEVRVTISYVNASSSASGRRNTVQWHTAVLTFRAETGVVVSRL